MGYYPTIRAKKTPFGIGREWVVPRALLVDRYQAVLDGGADQPGQVMDV